MTLYEALEKSMAQDNSDQLLTDLAEARKKKKKRQGSPKTPPGSPPHPPPPPPPPAGPSGSLEPLRFWVVSIHHLSSPPFQHQVVYLLMDDRSTTDEHDTHLVGEDVGHDHIPTRITTCLDPVIWHRSWTGIAKRKESLKLIKRPGWPVYEIIKVFHPDVVHLQFQMEECHKLLTDQVDDAILRLSIILIFAIVQMVPKSVWIEEECKYDIAAMYGISHWWFQRKRFYIDQHTSEGDRRAVRTHMRILNVVRIEVFPMYGNNYIKNIVLCRADLKEYVIAERDFKYLYPSDFEDLYFYQTQSNLTKPQWDAKGFEYKQDFTVIDSPRAITFRDKYGVQMILRFNEIHKFSDGTPQQIDEALDYRVKEFRVNRMNPGLDIRFWTKKDVDRSKEFMFSIQKRLKTKRIFPNLGKHLHKDGDTDALFHFRNSDKYYHDPEECEYADPKVTTSHEGNIPQQG
ncbi:hypothetical protein Tco_0746131 [Tanacetum coccineum]